MFLLGVLLSLSACTSVEDKRIRQLLNEKGFGTRAQGIATLENYVAGGDFVRFIVPPDLYLQPGYEQLYLLTSAPQPVGIDGTILVPYLGPVYVLGLTRAELSDTVESLLQPLFELDINLQADILDRGKHVFAFGEFSIRGRIPLQHDLTILEFVAINLPTDLANTGRIHVVRPDAEHPLTVSVNIREMVLTGNTTYNILLQDNDIVYAPPTFFGHVARFLERLLRPLQVVVQALFGAATVRLSYDYLTGNEDNRFVRFRF